MVVVISAVLLVHALKKITVKTKKEEILLGQREICMVFSCTYKRFTAF